MRFGSTAKVLLKCRLKYYRISECIMDMDLEASPSAVCWMEPSHLVREA